MIEMVCVKINCHCVKSVVTVLCMVQSLELLVKKRGEISRGSESWD